MTDVETALNEIKELLAQGKDDEVKGILLERYAAGFYDGKVVMGFKGARI